MTKDVRRVPTAPGSQGYAPEPVAQSQSVGADPSRDWLMTDSNRRGEQLRPGDYVAIWEEGEYPYGKPANCPFCKAEQKYTELWYNGPGSPPSYSVCCGHCGAQGPTSHGHFRGDHYGACVDAVGQWNAGRDSDRSGEAGETGTGSTEGESAARRDRPDTASPLQGD